MISIDITVLFHIINMIVLMMVLNKILYRPVLSLMDRRLGHLEAMNGEIEKLERRAREHQAEVDRKMHEAGVKAKKALDAARSEAEAARVERLAAVRSDAEQERERELAEVWASFDVARQELAADLDGVAREMAAKILGRSVAA
jgi:F-type H+-transporting ATPase subunit b